MFRNVTIVLLAVSVLFAGWLVADGLHHLANAIERDIRPIAQAIQRLGLN